MNKVSHFSTPIISRPVFDYFLSVDYFTSRRQPYYVHSLKATTNLRPSRCFRSSDVSWRDAAVWNTLQALRGCASPQVAPAAGVGQTGYKPRSVTGRDQRRRRPARYTRYTRLMTSCRRRRLCLFDVASFELTRTKTSTSAVFVVVDCTQ